ncbi:MAG: DUF2007 domain-containing protein [Bacteroidales bacterium]|nr:DUF2007 domain-containing protein [Bacteroidales bacterium]
MNEELSHVFTGSEIDADFIQKLLEENGIGVLNRNTMQESLIAGWASGSPEDACQLYVEEFNAIKAAKIVADYLANR